MSKETLINDTIEVIKYICQKYSDKTVILVGHSMGGSIATKTLSKIVKDHPESQYTKQILGLFVIDVVEGSAMDALPFMEDIVLSRP